MKRSACKPKWRIYEITLSGYATVWGTSRTDALRRMDEQLDKLTPNMSINVDKITTLNRSEGD